jgi:predicted SAM-dependent methyltransferase
VRLNIGSGPEPLAEWTNVDLRPPADIVGDFTRMEFAQVEEVLMRHVLEHVSWRSTDDVLRRVRSWMIEGGTLTIEVPDMDAILELGTRYANWQQWIFGDHSRQGEEHRAGFTKASLRKELKRAGFRVRSSRTFLSGASERPGYPCLEVVAVAA